MKKIAGLAVALASVLVLSACAPGQGANTYSRNQARTEQSVRMGTVEGVRTVRLEGTRTPIGTVAGGVVGGVAGSTIGGGRGSTIAAVLGAVGGEQELGEVVGTDRDEVGHRQEIVQHLDEGGHLDHGTISDA